ncbi:MAG: hypothetical protein AABW49_02485 [Nanoarchaeota archaeon]
MVKCPRCKSEDIELIKYKERDCIFCNYCGYEQRTLVEDIDAVNKLTGVRTA